jgi:hypothetical protein
MRSTRLRARMSARKSTRPPRRRSTLSATPYRAQAARGAALSPPEAAKRARAAPAMKGASFGAAPSHRRRCARNLVSCPGRWSSACRRSASAGRMWPRPRLILSSISIRSWPTSSSADCGLADQGRIGLEPQLIPANRTRPPPCTQAPLQSTSANGTKRSAVVPGRGSAYWGSAEACARCAKPPPMTRRRH